MIEFADGSVKAHLGATDMRIPIQYAFSHPRRWPTPLAPVDFAALGHLDFAEPDLDTFGCLVLAFEAGHVGRNAARRAERRQRGRRRRVPGGTVRLPRHRAYGGPRAAAHDAEPSRSVDQVEQSTLGRARSVSSSLATVAAEATAYTRVARGLHLRQRHIPMGFIATI